MICVNCIGLYQLGSALKQGVDKILITCCWGLLKQLEYSIEEFLKMLLKARQAKINDHPKDMQSTHNNGIVISLKGIQQNWHKWIQLGF